MFKPLNKHRRGFTLTEIAIVLGIIGLILGAIWIAASGVSSANQTRQATAEVTQILTNYRKLYATHGVDMADNTDVTCLGITAGFFPPEMVPSGATCTASASGTTSYAGDELKTPWSEALIRVQVEQSTQRIIISFRSMNQTHCNNFGDAMISSPEIVTIGTLTPPTTPQAVAKTLCPLASNDVYVAFKAR